MLFEKQFLLDSLDAGDESTVYDKIIDTSRWSNQYERVFKHEGKFYRTYYQVGATEQQDERPYENDPDMIECGEVKPVEKVVIVYEEA